MAVVTKAALKANILSLLDDGGASTAAELRSLLDDIVDSSQFTAGSIDDLTDPQVLDLAADYLQYHDASEGGARKALLESVFYYRVNKSPVRVATTASGTLASSFENGDTIDGISLVTGDRILLKDQSTASENGVYTVNVSGAPTRATDFNTSAKAILGSKFYVEEGTSNEKSTFYLTAPTTAITLDTSNLTFEEVSAGAATSAGTYTPTITNVSNITSATLVGAMYSRVGDIVTLSISIDVDPASTSTSTSVRFGLPFSSTFGNTWECSGTANNSIQSIIGSVSADTANNEALFSFVSLSTGHTSANWRIVAQYIVL